MASTWTTITECAAGTASVRPVPRWFPHSMPPRPQPFVRRAPPARVRKLTRFLHTLPPAPSEPRLPSQSTHYCSHPIPGSHSRPPDVAASITTTVQIHPPITLHSTPYNSALNPLRPIAPVFVCWLRLTTVYGASTVLTGRHPKTTLFAV